MNNQEWSVLNQDLTRGEYIIFDGAHWQTLSGRVVLIGEIVVNKFGKIAVVIHPDPMHPNGLAVKGDGFALIRR